MTRPPLVRPRTPFAQQAARASWMAPLVAIGFGILTAGSRDDRTTAIVVGGANALIILLGFAFAVVALAGIRRHGREGLLVPALIGLVLNGLLIASMAVTWSAASRIAAARSAQQAGGGGGSGPALSPAAARQARDAEMRRLEQRGADMVRNHPGWLGAADHRGAVFAVTQWANDAELVVE